MRLLFNFLFLLLIFPVQANAQSVPAPEGDGPLIVAVREVPPFAMRDSAGNWEGLSIELWQEVARRLNRPFQWVELSLDQTWQALESGEAELAVAALSVTPNREADFDFSHPYYITGLAPAFRAGSQNVLLNTLRAFLTGDFLRAVGSLALVLLAAGSAIWFFERKHNPEFGGNDIIRGLGDGFWWSAVTMTTVGYGDKAPQTLGGRLVALVWMFMSLIIIASFTASIAVSLTTSTLSENSLRQLPVSDLRAGVLAGSTADEFVSEQGARVQQYDSLADALTDLEAGAVQTVVHDAPILRYRIRQGFPNLEVASRILMRDDYAFAMNEDSELRESVNAALLSIIQEPVWERIRNLYLGSDDVI